MFMFWRKVDDAVIVACDVQMAQRRGSVLRVWYKGRVFARRIRMSSAERASEVLMELRRSDGACPYEDMCM